MKTINVVIQKIVLSDFQENAYIVSLNRSSNADCVIIDPGMDPEPLISFLQKNNLTPKSILITHGHWDHIGGISLVRQKWNDVLIYVGINERSKLHDPDENLSSYFGFPKVTQDADYVLHDGEQFETAGLSFKALEVPGHSKGHLAYLLETSDQSIVFCGDVIFAGSVGRTDFPDGNMVMLIDSIREQILSLPDDTILYPGHGPSTTVHMEKQNNPFLQRSF